jgi:hypothetical protein
VWLVAILTAGCASAGGSGDLLVKADASLAAAQYRTAVAQYDQFLQSHPDDPASGRARATRETIERLLASEGEAERLRRELTARETEVTRVRVEYERARSDGDRLRAEVERLRADLQRLRNIDLRQLQPLPPPAPAPTPSPAPRR